MDGGMYVGVGNKVGRAGSEELCVNAPVGGRGEVVTYLHSYAFPFQYKH
jgi:hypothetical protein